MKNAYPSYQEFHMHQPFFSFDVKQYEEQVQTTPYTARFYQFSTHKIIDRSQNQDLFMVCIPDGCVDVVFIQHDQQYKLELIGSPLARKPLIVYPDAAYFGIRMKPGMFFPDVPLSIREVAKTETFVPQLSPAVCSLMERLFATEQLSERVAIVQSELAQTEPESCTVPEAVQDMLYLMASSNGELEISEIAETLCYSERHLNRMFSETLGYAPKMFARITRFQAALHTMMQQSHEEKSISDYITMFHYADQAHFQRECKEFTGLTPKHFVDYYLHTVCPQQEGKKPI